MKTYESPKIEIILFESEDIITTSNDTDGNPYWEIPSENNLGGN